MKHSFLVLLFFTLTVASASSCEGKDVNLNIENNDGDNMNNKINITVNSKTFTATLLDNNTAKAFMEMLPLTITMIELHGNEKYYELPKNLPTNSFNPGTINNGDLMLFGSKTLVLFYKTVSTSYSYTKLGTVNDPSGIAAALGRNNVTVTFEME